MPRATSKVWMHFTPAIVEGKTVYICKYCAKAYVRNATKLQRHVDKCIKGSEAAIPGESSFADIQSSYLEYLHNSPAYLPLESLKKVSRNFPELVTQPPCKKAKTDHISESIREEAALHIPDDREYEERLRKEAKEEQKEERANLMTMWKEMMEFQGNLLKEFIHHPSAPTPVPCHKRAHYNQSSSSFPSTSTNYIAQYDSPGMETENESAISQEEEEEKYVPSEIPVVLNATPVNCTNDSQSNITFAPSPPPSQSTEKVDLKMSVLRRQEKVLQLQEEYYSLKIKYLKDKMARDQEQNNKGELFS